MYIILTKILVRDKSVISLWLVRGKSVVSPRFMVTSLSIVNSLNNHTDFWMNFTIFDYYVFPDKRGNRHGKGAVEKISIFWHFFSPKICKCHKFFVNLQSH